MHGKSYKTFFSNNNATTSILCIGRTNYLIYREGPQETEESITDLVLSIKSPTCDASILNITNRQIHTTKSISGQQSSYKAL